MKGRYAPKDEYGNRVWSTNGMFFAYAGCFQGEVVRGKGSTKEQAVEDSIKNTNEEQK